MATKIAELLKVQPTGALVDFVTDQRDGYLDFGSVENRVGYRA